MARASFVWSCLNFPFPAASLPSVAMLPTHNLHVKESIRLIAPRDLKVQLPMTETANQTVVAGRESISAILKQTDHGSWLSSAPARSTIQKARSNTRPS